jgi:hypothetical protein
MNNFDKSYSRWQVQQARDKWRSHERARRRELDAFAKENIKDADWWEILSFKEKNSVYLSFVHTREYSNREDVWFSGNPEIAPVEGSSWKECIPQWVKYIKERYPKDPNTRRELAIRRILS